MNEAYHRFNEELMKTLGSESYSEAKEAVPAQSGISNGADFLKTAETFGTGSLIVQVTLAGGAIPVSGAKVIVSESDGDNAVISELVTDNSGRTEKLFLPAPIADYSRSPKSDVRPYSTYNITVELAGYYTEKAINVPIFDQTVSLQEIALIPLPEKSTQETLRVIDEGAGPNL